MHKRIALILIAAALAAPVLPQEAASELEETVVTAARIETGVLDAPGIVTVITRDDIAASGASTVAEAITRGSKSGVAVGDYGTDGGMKSASIRGSTSEQVLVLIDGMRLNSGRDGTVDLSTIPLASVERIEIVRGGAGSLYGTSAIGGVINIITRKPKQNGISAGVSSTGYVPHDANAVTRTFPATVTQPAAADPLSLLDAQTVELCLAGRLGDVVVSGGGAFLRAANAYTWYDTLGLGDWRIRTNADHLEADAFAGLDSPLWGGSLAVKGMFRWADTGAPGSLSMVSASAGQTDMAASGLVSWKTGRFLADGLTLDAKAMYRYDALSYSDPEYGTESAHRTHSAGLDAVQSWTATDGVSLVYGAAAGYDNVESSNYGAARDRLNAALFVSAPLCPLDGITVTPSARYDWFSDFPGAFSGALRAVWLITEDSALKASAGSAYRVPTLNDLYWYDPSGYTAGNPSLVPETSYDGELGYSLLGWKIPGGSISGDASLFARCVLDNIVWESAGFVWMPQNYRTAFFPGAELQAGASLWECLSVKAGYTFIYSFLLNDGAVEHGFSGDLRVPYVPVHSANLRVELSLAGHAAGVELRYAGSRFTDAANTQDVEGYFLLNADYRLALNETLSFTAAARNILNAEYQTQAGYPMPPFSLRMGADLRL